jgi:hypothetical protein
MARTIEEGFSTFLNSQTPSTTETAAAASHRASIEACLKSNRGMTNFFRSGSFGFGTSVSGYSDVDYFAVFPAHRLEQSSTISLNAIGGTLRDRFPNTGVHVDSPAIVVPFGSSPAEKHEIIPAHFIGLSSAQHNLYGIPDRVGGWTRASPDATAAWVNAVDKKLGGKAKALIRLMKAWKYHCDVPIRSFYLELRTTAYASTESAIIYSIDVRSMLMSLSNNLNTVAEPETASTVYSCFTHELQTVKNKIATALTWTDYARSEEAGGRIGNAFNGWDKVFGGAFPAYY